MIIRMSAVLRLAVALMLLAFVLPVRAQDEALVRQLLEAHRAGQAYPLVSREVRDVEAAYRLQHRVVADAEARGEHIAGFKGGLTGPGSAEKYGLKQPVVGALMASGRLEDGAVVPLASYRRLGIEMEIGVVFNRAVEAPLPDVAALRGHLAGVVAAVELPELGFAEPVFTGIDLVASNTAARQYLLGRVRPLETPALPDLTVTLWRDGRQVNAGQGRDAMGDPWQAALWLTNELIARGYRIASGQVLITGVLGPILPGAPGQYSARFGPLGDLHFSIQ